MHQVGEYIISNGDTIDSSLSIGTRRTGRSVANEYTAKIHIIIDGHEAKTVPMGALVRVIYRRWMPEKTMGRCKGPGRGHLLPN